MRLAIVAACFLPPVARAAEPVGAAVPASDSPYRAPEWERLMDAVTLHVSFDAGTALPDMAAGDKYLSRVFGQRSAETTEPQFAPGLVGRAMVLGTGGGIYPRRGNVMLENRGALALWVKPLDWQRPNDGNTVFAMTTNATFYLQRQGPLRGDEGQVVRQENVQYLARAAGSRLANIGGGSAWENGRWYLLVANWSWPNFALSVNGEPLQSKSLSPAPSGEDFGNLCLGGDGRPRGLLDEVFAFRRPLSMDEIRLLYRLAERADR